MGNYFVYILTNSKKAVLYIGMTNDLEQRLIEHYLKRGDTKSFAGKYYCYHLLYHERFASATQAIEREKELKGWNRKRKEALINAFNTEWMFLNKEIMDWPPHPGITARS
ncbi:GIY-YIG nuclease family protein [Catalinimonas niigatensis]|uniref:GIY-YIG nuclease family protein n=1 Tax=Catalinimonas niigatensis TaxID=1397264 RepID=UPI0026660A21|nr:GIY-YIG nuclease family protein [Catalinimonas niigatensis]WPP51114.1 GIY-YIG nuclease family protein [Catalinimonas niigatensis]